MDRFDLSAAVEPLHFFAAVWPRGATRWSLLCRCATAEERSTRLAAWEGSDARRAGGSSLSGTCRAGVSVAKLAKELRRLPAPGSPSYSFFVARLADRLGVTDAVVLAADVVGGAVVFRPETVH